MEVRCKICELKGWYDIDNLSEYYASRFLFISSFAFNGKKSCFICRKCLSRILSSVQSEQYRIDRLYKPEIEPKETIVKKIKKIIKKVK